MRNTVLAWVYSVKYKNIVYNVYICRDLFYQVEVTFCDKSVPSDQGFTLDLSQKMNYDQMANAVANHLGTDPYKLQFFKCQG